LFGLLKIKSLVWVVLLACPPVAVWVVRANGAPDPNSHIQTVSHVVSSTPAPETLQIPVEVVTEGQAPKWIYVEIQAQSIPEPGVVSLTLLASLLLLRRQR